ncbi:hypothetical protein D3Y57_19275 [Sphingomonas paeninsulae]|uniref:Tip attachment protein J domain-containing protein n=1 Tax=Sphingomonas paeninsulae TaxID=2319844 RepID=A0A494TPD6_SPHPE|nr:hypothetical protein [Sphingomonas paeninsulae]AYJ87676.1 hypothetical protein D3Y57_19275 [Sphingomonas paeninsulae]
MSKILKIAAVVVGVVAITVATAGIGTAPAIAASGTGFGAVAASAAVGASAFGLSVGTLTAVAAGLSLASSALAKKPQSGSAVGSPTNWKADVGAPLPYWIGRTLNAGSLVHRIGYPGPDAGVPNQLETFVTVYSGAGPIAGFDSYLMDKVATTFTGTNGAVVGTLAGYAWLTAKLGAQPEAAAHVAPYAVPPGWGPSAKLSGLASTMLTICFDNKGKVYPTGEPKLAIVGRGVSAYDPRKDSTYPGGSGTQRSATESTWAYSDNPWLHALTWAIGRRSNGIRTIGVGMPIASIDVDAFVQAANVADANGWKIGGVVGSTDDKWNVLKQMCQAGGGEPVRQAAMLSCFVNAPKVSLATITADDLADGDISFPAMQPRRARINSIVPTYRSESHDWEVVAGDVVKGATYIVEDGETRTRQVDYPLVQCFAGQQPTQAAQLAAYDIVNAREYGPIPIPLKPAWIRFKNGDCLTLNIPDANLVNQTAIILKRGLDPSNGSVSLTFRSETAAKHAFALGKTTTAPPTPSISAPPVNPYWMDPNATRDITLVDVSYSGTININGNSLSGNGSGGDWTTGGADKNYYTSSEVAVRMASLQSRLMIGLTSRASFSAPIYTKMEYAIYSQTQGSGSAYLIFESGKNVFTVPTIVSAPDDYLQVINDGAVVRYYINGTLVYKSLVAPGGIKYRAVITVGSGSTATAIVTDIKAGPTLSAIDTLAGSGAQNLIYNGGAELGTTAGWVTNYLGGAGPVGFYADPTYAQSGKYSFVLSKSATSDQNGATCKSVAVMPGEIYNIKVFLYGIGSSSTGLYLRPGESAVEGYPASQISGSPSPDFVANGPVANGLTVYDLVYTVPAGVYFFSLNVIAYTGTPSIAFEAAMLKQIGARNLLTDGGVDLATVVPGTFAWKTGSSGTQTTTSGASAADTGVINGTGTGTVTAGTRVTLTGNAAFSAATGYPGQTASVALQLYYNVNGAGWVFTGVSVANNGGFQNINLQSASWIVPVTGKMQFAYNVHSIGSGGMPVTVTSHSINLEVINFK